MFQNYLIYIPTDELLDKVLTDCIKLREKILRNHHKNFKEKLEPNCKITLPIRKHDLDIQAKIEMRQLVVVCSLRYQQERLPDLNPAKHLQTYCVTSLTSEIKPIF